MILDDSGSDPKSFLEELFHQQKTTSLRRAQYTAATQGETSPPATSTETGAAPILGKGKDDNEERD